MENLEKEMYTKKVKNLKEKISEEFMMIKEYESQIDDLENEISDYEDDYDLNHKNNLREEIEETQKLISRCEWEIQSYEEELNQIEFWLGDCTIQLLLQKWEKKLVGYFNKRNDCENDYRNGDYQTEEDYHSDWGKLSGMIDVTNQLIEDIKHLVEK